MTLAESTIGELELELELEPEPELELIELGAFVGLGKASMHPGWPELAVRVEAEAGLLAEEDISLDPASASSHAQRNRVEEAGLLAEEDRDSDPASASRDAQRKRVEEEKRQA